MTGYVKTTTDNQFVEYPYGAEELMRDNPGLGYTPYSDFVEIFPTTDAYNVHGYRIQYVEIDADPTYDGKTQTVQSDVQRACSAAHRPIPIMLYLRLAPFCGIVDRCAGFPLPASPAP